MADTKITQLATATSVAAADLFVIADDPAGSPVSRSLRMDAIRTDIEANANVPPYIAITTAETNAGVTPVDYTLPEGNVLRYGANISPGVTDMSAALQAAIDANNNGGDRVVLPSETLAFGTSLSLYSRTTIVGHGKVRSYLDYTGAAEAFVNATPGTRIYDITLRDFYLNDGGTGTVGIDFDSISTSEISNVQVSGFTTGVEINSPTSGYAVYNRLNNVTASNATDGFKITGTSSNANALNACRTNICTTGVLIEDSNENYIKFCQLESGTTGVKITASQAGISPRNYISESRFEGNTEDFNIGTNVSDTVIFMNHNVNGKLYTDNGTRTQIIDVQSAASLMSLVSALASTDGTPFGFERTTSGGSNIPAMKIVDSATSTGTPTTLQVETGRPTGHAFRVLNGVGGTESFGIEARGRIRTNQDTVNVNTPAGATAYQFPIYDEAGVLLGYIPVYAAAW